MCITALNAERKNREIALEIFVQNWDNPFKNLNDFDYWMRI